MSFECIECVAVSENVVRLKFTYAVYFSGILDKRDASRTSLFTITAVEGTVGADESTVWPVSVSEVKLTDTRDETRFPPPSAGRYLDIVVDRSFTPNPAQYTIVIGDLFTYDIFDGAGDPVELSGGTRTFVFNGNHRVIEETSAEQPIMRRDVANANTKRGLAGTINPESPSYLGVYSADETGDYATDEGEVSLIKRLDRRTFSSPGGFLHLGEGYGLGLKDYIKKLGTAVALQMLRTKAEEQYRQEPEVLKVKVDVRLDSNNPNLLWFHRKIKTKKGAFFRTDVAVPIS